MIMMMIMLPGYEMMHCAIVRENYDDDDRDDSDGASSGGHAEVITIIMSVIGRERSFRTRRRCLMKRSPKRW